jgi:dTMP kinase
MRTARRGRLIAVEGIDGAGKTTVVAALARELRRRGRSVRTRREPADRELGAAAQRAGARDPWTGAVYFTIDRFRARPGLERDLARHDLVVTDRSMFSTLAYQGSGLSRVARARLEELQRRATVVPDRVVLLDLSAAEARRRRGRRATARAPLEREAVQRRVAAEYRTMARARGWIVVDAGQPVARIAREVAERLPGPRRDAARRRR